MSADSKKKTRKAKLVPGLYTDNEEATTEKQMEQHNIEFSGTTPNYEDDQISSIKIIDVKTIPDECFESPQRPASKKTYPSKSSLAKPKSTEVSSAETVTYKVTQSNTKRITIVSKLKTPATIVSESNTPEIVVSQPKTLPTILSELKDVTTFITQPETTTTLDSELETPSTVVPQPKTEPIVVSEVETPSTVVPQPKTEPTIVTELETPATLNLQHNSVPSLVLDAKAPMLVPGPKTIPTVVSEWKSTSDLISGPEPTPAVVSPATIVPQIKSTPTLIAQLEAPQAPITNMLFRMSVDVEVEEFDDEDRLQIDESAYEDEEIKMEVEDIEKLEVEMEIEFNRSRNRRNLQNLLIEHERASRKRETAIGSTAHIVIKTEKDDTITNQLADNNVKLSKTNLNTNQINRVSNKNNVATKKNNTKSKHKSDISKQSNVREKQKKKITKRDNVSLNEINISWNQINMNSSMNIVESKQLISNNLVSNPLVTANEASNESIPISEYSITESQILSVSEQILTTSKTIADRILAVEARNIIGRIAKEKSCEINPIESKIQYALDDWKNWTAGSRRPPPLLYKCYICKQSWWHLTEFREHLLKHNEWNLKVSVEETAVEECNIIAYTDMATEVTDVEPNGDCWRCGYNYEIHKISNRQFDSYYTCEVCSKHFSSCTGLREHEFASTDCRKTVGNYKCLLCPMVNRSTVERRSHMIQKHSVRSDLPISTSYKRCNDCGSKYFIYNMHNCRNKLYGSQCNFCYRKFNHRLLAELHMTIGNSNYKCKICSLVLPKQCMELEHVLMHSTMFIFPYKCITCEDFNVYLGEEETMQHRYIKHKQKYDKKKNYFDKVLVPISCILPTYTSPESNTEQFNENLNAHPSRELPLIPEIKLEVIDEEHVNINNEPEELIIKEENLSDEEYEDDIIRLNYDHSDLDANRRKPKIYNCRRCPFKGTHKIYKEHLFTKCGRISTVMRTPKVYLCAKCNFQGHHLVYKEHLKADCSKHSYVNEEVYTCTKCDTNFDSIKRYLAHFSSHYYKYQQCPVCLINFNSFSTLIIHFNSHVRHNYIRMYSIQCDDDASQKSNQFSVCKVCSEEVAFAERFVHWEYHLILNINPNTVTVADNPIVGNDESDSADTEYVDKNNLGLKSDMLELLLEHLRCERKRIRQCPLCFRNFSRNNDSKRHFIEHLLNDAYAKWSKYNALQCQICGQQYKKPDKYKRHMRDHGCLPIFQCEVCDKAFSDSSNFTKHKKVHNMKVLICDLCQKKFQAKSSLIKHMEMHKTSKPMECAICGKHFSTDTQYRRHMRIKHKNAHKRNYSCLICKQRFYTCKEKWEHCWEVHKERSYKADCDACGESFRTFMALKRHIRSNCGRSREDKVVFVNSKFKFDESVLVRVNKGDGGVGRKT